MLLSLLSHSGFSHIHSYCVQFSGYVGLYTGRTARPRNGRFRVIPVILCKQYSGRKFFRWFPARKHRKLTGIHRKKSSQFPARILIQCWIGFRCFPTWYGDFPASFLQDPEAVIFDLGRNTCADLSSLTKLDTAKWKTFLSLAVVYKK